MRFFTIFPLQILLNIFNECSLWVNISGTLFCDSEYFHKGTRPPILVELYSLRLLCHSRNHQKLCKVTRADEFTGISNFESHQINYLCKPFQVMLFSTYRTLCYPVLFWRCYVICILSARYVMSGRTVWGLIRQAVVNPMWHAGDNCVYYLWWDCIHLT